MPKRRAILLLIILSGCGSAPPPAPPIPDEDPAAKVKATLDAIEEARHDAYSRYLECKVEAERAYNDGLEEEGTPTPGNKGSYREKYPGAFDKLKEQQNFDNAECRKVYEAELGLIQPRVQPPAREDK